MRGSFLKKSALLRVSGAAIAAVGLTLGPAAVAEIEVIPRLQVRQSWTDNANLDIATLRRESAFVTTVSPGVQVSGNSNRVRTFIDYTLNGLVFWNDTDNSDLRHDLSAAVNTEVVQDRFFIDLRGSVRQQFQNLQGPISASQANFTANRATVQNYAGTARWREDFGNFATANLSYTYGITEIGGQSGDAAAFGLISDARSHNSTLSIRSGPRFDRFTWNWVSRFRQTSRLQRDLDFESYESILDLRYDLTRKVGLVGSVGYENISDDLLAAEQRGVVWDAGLVLRPGPRTQIEGRAGRRFDDTVFSGSVSYAFSATDVLTARYSEDVTVQNNNFLRRLDGFVDQDDDGIPDIPVDDPLFDPDGFLTDAAFRQKRAVLNFQRQLPRTTLAASAFWQRLEFSPTTSSSSYGAFVNGAFRLDGAQTVSAQINYRNTRFANGLTDDFVSVAPQYTYRFSPTLNASARYIFGKRFSPNPFLERTENTISIALTAFF